MARTSRFLDWEEENIYNEDWREGQVESDAMEPWEEAFMRGWDEAMQKMDEDTNIVDIELLRAFVMQGNVSKDEYFTKKRFKRQSLHSLN